ncbi:iron-containing alcohol dehydrogenase [Niabella hibiscisoli]|nr:iron-containing alcohol dehydrogenase [Niabella hibiscisoli]MCH5720203.1 iron-containing alcohol dehydrogenase [Niabella hibiscisoli]
MELTNNLKIFFPGKLVFANGSLDQLAAEVQALLPSKVFIVTIVPLQNTIEGFIKQLKSAGVAVQTDTSIVQEPTFSDFEKLMQKVQAFNPDVVIGIGGGSVLILPSWLQRNWIMNSS